MILALILILFTLCCCGQTQQTNSNFLRIHIRADSNTQNDQSIKYAVKDAIMCYLTPYICNITTKQQAISVVKQHLNNIKNVCDTVLKNNNFDYVSTVKLCQENFPDRAYNNLVLPSGVYDALIVELGSGSGNNWWCVVYPPLCFVGDYNGTNSIVYKSKLQEVISDWMQKCGK